MEVPCNQQTLCLYILVPFTTPSPNALEIDGRFWSLQPSRLDASSASDGLKYSCISYTWGTGREPSPFNPSFSVSDRTIPALQAFIRLRPSCTCIWIDAFCVPLTEPERAQTLESMGYIYAQADEVLVVLSSAALPALACMNDSNNLEVADLAVLEREEWVERAWTYQETVNSKELLLTCEGEGSPLIPAMKFFSTLTYALLHLEGSFVDTLRTYPRLNAFEDIMADYYTAAFEERAALNIMSNMDRRVQQRAADHFYAMIGAISTERASTTGEVSPCETFLNICERKGDFSFIYSAAKREDIPGRRWRPLHGDLPSILPWHGVGTGQPGRLDDAGLWLDKMVVFQPGSPQERSTQFVQQWLSAFWERPLDPQQNLKDAAYNTLQVMGFTGSKQCVTAAEGYFFPFEAVTQEQVHHILVSTAIVWTLGAPGLVSYQVESEIGMLYTPGVYVGTAEGYASTSIHVA